MILLKENNREIHTVVFDLGNVLLDYSPYRFLGQIGIDSDLHADIGAALFENSEVWSELDRGTLDSAGVTEKAISFNPALDHEITQYMESWYEYFEMVPNNVETLYRIKDAGCKIYVLSNFSAEVFEKIRWKFPFLNDLDGMIISAEHLVIKPDPEIYQLLIDTYHIQPEGAVFIDDLKANVETAAGFGFSTIHLAPCADIEPYFVFPQGALDEKKGDQN